MILNENHENYQFENSDLYAKFCGVLPAVCQLIEQDNYNESLNLINDFYSKNAERDYGDLLKYECDKWIALIFEKAGHYEQAFQTLKRLYRQLKPRDEMFISYQTNVVRVLLKMYRSEDAILESEITLDNQVDGDIIDLLTLLFYYIQALGNLSKQLPDKYFDSVKIIINKLSPKLSELDLINSENLCKIVSQIYEQHTAANKRYSKLVVALNATNNILYRISLLKSYIENETFDFYKHIALEELHDLEQDFS